MTGRVWLAVSVAALGCAALVLVACDDSASAEDSPGSTLASEFRAPSVERTLDAAGEVMQTRGFAPTEDGWRGFLVDQGSEVRGVPMRSGQCRVLLAAGSSALGELDLRLFDSDGSDVAQDARPGPRAALLYCPPRTGTYYVAVLATSGTGLFAVRSFAGPTGLDVRLDDVYRDAVPVADP